MQCPDICYIVRPISSGEFQARNAPDINVEVQIQISWRCDGRIWGFSNGVNRIWHLAVVVVAVDDNCVEKRNADVLYSLSVKRHIVGYAGESADG